MGRGRPRKFDEREVLRSAADVFSERGFAGASTQVLSEAMKMGGQSIYNTFGNKQKLFERALDQYIADSNAGLQALSSPEASLPAIEACLWMSASRTKPCLVARTCLSQDVEGPAVAHKISQHMQNVESAFLQALKNAIEKGEIKCDDPVKLARYLNMTAVGISVMARSGMSKQALRQLVDVSLQVVHRTRCNRLQETSVEADVAGASGQCRHAPGGLDISCCERAAEGVNDGAVDVGEGGRRTSRGASDS